ncbi:gibberellin receptor, partial [Musa troglodytarum]
MRSTPMSPRWWFPSTRGSSSPTSSWPTTCCADPTAPSTATSPNSSTARFPPTPLLVNGVVSFDVLIDRPNNLLARIYRPAPSTASAAPLLTDLYRAPSSDPFPVIIFFHGGSFASSSNSAIYDSLCADSSPLRR